MFYLELKDCITQERENQGLTQEQLAQELKAESQCVGNYEAGRRQPNLETLMEMTKIFNRDLLTRNGKFRFVEAGKVDYLLGDYGLFNDLPTLLNLKRKLFKLTQQELADEISKLYPQTKLSNKSISGYEKGEREPQISTLMKLLSTLESELVISRLGGYTLCPKDSTPLYLSDEDHVKYLKSQFETFPKPITPNVTWSYFDEATADREGYCRDYSNFILPPTYKVFIDRYGNEKFNHRLREQLRIMFRNFVVEDLDIMDESWYNKEECFVTRLHFEFEDREAMHLAQLEEVEELLEDCKDDYVQHFDDNIYAGICDALEKHPVKRVKFYPSPLR